MYIYFALPSAFDSTHRAHNATQVKMCKKAVEPLEKWPDYLTAPSLASTNGFRIYKTDKKKKENVSRKKG
jgi:hypothetical protein